MLRISEPMPSRDGVAFRLDGRVIGPWVHELRSACEAVLARGEPLTLDLGGVCFADEAGVALLRTLAARGARLDNGSPFVVQRLRA
jgi:hypothetical protein